METTNEHQQSLMNAFRFDAADLEVNRTEHVSQKQLQNVAHESAKQGLYALLGFGISVVSLLVASLVYPQVPDNFGLYGMILVIFGISARFGWKYRLFLLDRAEKNCKVVEGQINQPQVRYKGYFITIESIQFDVTANQQYVFKNGDPYHIYYTPHSKWILSVEWLRDEDNLL